ncbi:hypothetical protein ACE10Z_35485 [Bradyrhizobium sp. Pha-3]|uniref:hypothetical protein n=1 Tax=Bradyrhizobium sp. Pha-3 TaxID=208375 RepID=UPI0035D4561A
MATRWRSIRHAPVHGCMYGQRDIGGFTSDRVVMVAVGKIAAGGAVCYRQTARRSRPRAFCGPTTLIQEAGFAEQNLGEWQGLNRAAFFLSYPIEVGWATDSPAPGRRDFFDLCP